MKNLLIAAVFSALAAPLSGQCRLQVLEPSAGNVHALAGSNDLMVSHDNASSELYVHRWSGTAWDVEQTLASPFNLFGWYDGIAISESHLVVVQQVGVEYHDMYIAERTPQGYGPFTYVFVTNPGYCCPPNDSVEVSFHEPSGRVYLGLPYNNDGRGAVMIYAQSGNQWGLAGSLLPPSPQLYAEIGDELEISGDVVAYSACNANTSGPDKVFLHDISVTTPVQTEVQSSDSADGFGAEIALDGDWLVVSTEQWNTAPIELFRRAGNVWLPTGFITPPVPYGGELVTDMDLEAGRLVVGVSSIDTLFEYRLDGNGATLLAVREQPGTVIGRDVVRSPLGTVALGHGTVFAWPEDALIQQACHCDSGAPCGNSAPVGGCRNVTETGVILSGCGSTSLARGDFALNVNRLPTSTFATPFMGTLGPASPVANGQLCLGGVLSRFVTFQSVGPDAALLGLVPYNQSHHAQNQQIVAGSTWSFQVWYRDNGGPCGATSNFSNAVSATFVP